MQRDKKGFTLSDRRCVHKASVPNSPPSSGKHQLMSTALYNIHLSSSDPHETFLTAHHGKSVYWLRWLCTGPAQYKHSWRNQEITVLSTLPVYRAPLKFTTKQRQKRAQKPYLPHCFSIHVLFLSQLSNQKTTSDRQECRIFWIPAPAGIFCSSSSPYMSQH